MKIYFCFMINKWFRISFHAQRPPFHTQLNWVHFWWTMCTEFLDTTKITSKENWSHFIWEKEESIKTWSEINWFGNQFLKSQHMPACKTNVKPNMMIWLGYTCHWGLHVNLIFLWNFLLYLKLTQLALGEYHIRSSVSSYHAILAIVFVFSW